MRHVMQIICVCALLSVSHGVAGQEDHTARLALLNPDEPMGYFLLGESIAYEFSDDDSQDLARRLFVLSMELDRRSANPAGLSSSVSFALADLAEDETDRRWLLALAESLVRASQRVQWNPLDSLANPEDARLRFVLIEAMAKQRDGDPRDAMDLQDDPAIAGVLKEIEEYLPGGVDRVVESLGRNTTCRECRGRRVTRDADGRFRICRTCHGDPGTYDLRLGELIGLLRVEGRLLDVEPQTWSGDLLYRGDAPLRALRVEEVAPRYGVDPLKPVYRDGMWVAREESARTLDRDSSSE